MTQQELEKLRQLAMAATSDGFAFIRFNDDGPDDGCIYTSDTCKPPIATFWKSDTYRWDGQANAEYATALMQNAQELIRLAGIGLECEAKP